MVRVGTPSAVARPDWYDRNPAMIWNTYNASGVAPHSLTTRWTYTVPTGKKALLEQAMTYIMRSTAATTLGWASLKIWYQPSGGTNREMVYVDLYDNTVAAKTISHFSFAMVLLAGDVLTGTSADTSTGGTCNYTLTAKATEFDA